jgi:hypothetical protein
LTNILLDITVTASAQNLNTARKMDPQPINKPSITRFKVLGFLFLLTNITYLDRLCISAAAPVITGAFGFSPSQMGYIFSAFTLAYAAFEIPSGWLGDYFGTRKALAPHRDLVVGFYGLDGSCRWISFTDSGALSIRRRRGRRLPKYCAKHLPLVSQVASGQSVEHSLYR